MQNSPLSLSFPALKSREVSLRFDGGDVTSDAGLALVALADRKLGVTAALTAAFQDRRQARKVDHPAQEIIAARVYAIAQGYEDGNDFDRLRHDPGLKTVCGHLPASGLPLTSQETLSRFEHAPTAKDLIRMGRALAEQVIAQVPADSSRVWIDVDPYDDPCHGHQQLSLFNGFYDAHCYLPLAVCVTGGDGVQRIVGVLLRPGNAKASKGLAAVLRGLVRRLRTRCPQATLILRADSGFGIAEVLRLCERLTIDYVLGVARNSVLQALGTPVQMDAALKCRWAGDGCREFGEFLYGARTWRQKCRMIIKAEVTQGTLNPRYVVTSLAAETPEALYALYCARGDRENRWKEFKLDLAAGRTSCTTFWANQTRLLWHVAASILCLAIREAAVGTVWATAQVSTLRTRLLKLGAKIVETCRKIWWHLPTSCPVQQDWARLFQQLC
jgi:hypothetical protein